MWDLIEDIFNSIFTTGGRFKERYSFIKWIALIVFFTVAYIAYMLWA